MKISKKIMALLIVSIISIGLIGCSSEETTQDTSGNDATKQEEQTETVDVKNLTIKREKWVSNLLEAEKIQDYNGNQALKLSYDFLNQAEESQTPFMSISFKAFQNGVELDTVLMSDNLDLGLGQKEVLPEGKIDKAETAFLLSDESEITLHVEEAISFDNNTSEFTINLETLEIKRTK